MRRFLGVAFVLLGLTAWPALAADSLYENDAVVTDQTPIPDATNFLNTGTYNVTVPSALLYQTHDTLNYTNTGFMSSVFGFYFDTFSTATSVNSEAASFDNENTIEAGSQIIVWATNIVNPGFMFVQANSGLMLFSGNSVDLSSAALDLEGGLSPGGVNTQANDYGIGTDTNGEWNPGFDLTPARATSSIFTTAGNPFANQILSLGQLGQTNLTSYFEEDPIGTNTVIIRAVFVLDENPAPQITHNVYFGASSIGSGLMTIEWLGVYTNEINSEVITNYLYLNDEPAPISSNGVNRVTVNANTGIPNNYTFLGSATQIPSGTPATEGFQSVFPFNTVTNNYSYVNAEFISTSIATNLLVNTNVSAIGGRIQVYATNEMNLNNISIQGENYLSLTSTNQFDGNNGATISAAFTDLNLAVTNGNLVVSNLLQSSVPVWDGNVQAWSTRWTVVVTNIVGTNQIAVTNDFRIELVEDAILPRSPAQVQNLTLTGTNSVIISDDLNIYGNVLINAQSLTLTTNGLGNGAASEEGELNVQNNDNVFLPASLPNLHWLTNNGVINLGNLAVLGNSAPVYSTNIIQGTNASGILSKLGGANVQAKSTLTIGTNKYAFVSKITNSVPNQIKIGTTFNGTLSNLIAAIDATAGSGVVYSTSTFHNTNVAASVLNTNSGSFTLKATFPGVAGNLIATTTTATNLSWHGFTTLTGGVDAVTNITNTVPGIYGALVNSGIISDQGSQISANYFESSGLINNGAGSFTLNANTAILTNAEVLTISEFSPFFFISTNLLFFTNQFGGFNGNETITANTLVISNTIMAAGGGFIFNVTNLLTDTGVTNNNFWFTDGGSLTGLNMAKKPLAGDLLGTTIEMLTPAPNKAVKNVWSGVDYGVSVNGYTNNEAIGQLLLDIPSANGSLNFSGTGTSNGMYVDRLVLEDYASYTNGLGTEQIPTLTFNTNLVIYYADAVASGEDVSYQLDNSNHGHLRWVPQYMGFFSSSNVVYMNGTVNRVNAGLVQSPYLDSNGNGIPNAEDPNPLFVASEVNFQAARTNGMEALVWDSITSATNYILYINCPAGGLMPDLSKAANWQVLTQFVSPSAVPPVGGWPITNVVFEPLLTKSNQFYRIEVSPNLGQ